MRTGDMPARYPIIGGHEGAGVIEEVGPGVTRVKKGDHVVCSFIPSCGRCRFCSTGQQNLCDMGATILEGKMPAVPLADVTLQQKDMLLALELGRKLGSPVPLAAAANEMMNACRGLGIDHKDFVAAHEVYRRLGGQS